jgi:CheY-like chemotaxis protein
MNEQTQTQVRLFPTTARNNSSHRGADVAKIEILVVNDDESVREAMSSLIRSLGFSVEVFSSGESFLRVRPSASHCLLDCRRANARDDGTRTPSSACRDPQPNGPTVYQSQQENKSF